MTQRPLAIVTSDPAVEQAAREAARRMAPNDAASMAPGWLAGLPIARNPHGGSWRHEVSLGGTHRPADRKTPYQRYGDLEH